MLTAQFSNVSKTADIDSREEKMRGIMVVLLTLAILASFAVPSGTIQADGVCRLDKIGTWSEIQGAGPQRIEVGGGGVQHTDYYPNRGVKAVSYIVPRQEPMVWFGFGSIWEAPNSLECESFNWIQDATGYALGRLDSGHSGIVVDLRSGSTAIVANVANLSQAQIDQVLASHRAGQQLPAQAPISVYQPVPAALAPSQPSCEYVARYDYAPVPGQPWIIPEGTWRILNGWSNWAGQNQSQFKVLVSPEVRLIFQGGGSLWVWPSTCETPTRGNFASNPLPEQSLDQLRARGLLGY